MGGYQTGEHGNTRFNCGSAALCHTISCSLGCNPAHAVGKTQPRAASPQNAQRRRIFGDPEAVLLTARESSFFANIFEGDAAISSFVYLRFGRSRFLCRYERAYSHIPMLRFGMWASSSPQHAQRQKRACRGPRLERALALRSVGMARVEGMGGYQTGEHGNTRFNCGSAALCHTISCSLGCNPAHAVGKTQPRAASPQNAQRRRIFGDPEAVLLTARESSFFANIFEGDAAISSFVYLRFGRSRFLCRYERAYSHIPMLRFGMWASSSPQHAQRQKRACRGPRLERALALRSVGMARVEGMGGYQTGEHGNTRFNCGSAALCHTISCSLGCNPAHAVGKTQPRAASPQNAQRRRIFGDPEAVLLTARIFFFREYFRGGCSNKQFCVPALWAEQIPLSLRAPISHIPMLRFGMWTPRPPQHAQRQENARVGAPARTRARFTLCRNGKG